MFKDIIWRIEMKKLLSFLAGCLLAGTVTAQVCGTIKITGVVDGDTLRAEIVGMYSPLNRVLIRIAGIDTPEIRGHCPQEKELAQSAKKYLSQKLLETRAITMGTMEWDKYGGRILADVYFEGQDVGKMMINAGFAMPYSGSKKGEHWCVSP